MKIGIFGGSFNPFHLGHEKIVYSSIEKLNLDLLIIVPVGIPSHKQKLNSADLRFSIIEKIFESDNKIVVSDIEIKNKNTSYTYDTLMKIKEIYGKHNEYFEIIGEDSLENFKKWKNYDKILEEAFIVVFKRKNYKATYNDKKIIYIDNQFFLFSATEIRNKLKNNEDISCYVNEKVKSIIEEGMKEDE